MRDHVIEPSEARGNRARPVVLHTHINAVGQMVKGVADNAQWDEMACDNR